MRRPVPSFYYEYDAITEEVFATAKVLFTRNGWLRKGMWAGEPGVCAGRHLWLEDYDAVEIWYGKMLLRRDGG